jgi:excisionase family DNA binding protein
MHMDDSDKRARLARQTNPFLTMKQAAFHLGLSLRSFQRLQAAGTGPRGRRHGRSWRFHIDDIEAWSRDSGTGGEHD